MDLGGRCTGESDDLEGSTKTREHSGTMRSCACPGTNRSWSNSISSTRRVRRQSKGSSPTLAARLSIPRRALPHLHFRSTRSLPKVFLFSCPVDSLEEDPDNPRTEFPERGNRRARAGHRSARHPSADRCAPACRGGRFRVLFGAKRLRAARRAGLEVVPVVIGSDAHDGYAQVAENQKRHGLTPLDLARFMRSRADAGDSNAEIAKRLGMDLTSVAHHLALLTLPPELDEAFRSGRCTSPRTLYELAKLQKTRPERVKAIVNREGEITRSAVASVRKARWNEAPCAAQGGRVAPSDRSCQPGERSDCAPRIALRSHDQARLSGHGGRTGRLAAAHGWARQQIRGRTVRPLRLFGSQPLPND